MLENVMRRCRVAELISRIVVHCLLKQLLFTLSSKFKTFYLPHHHFTYLLIQWLLIIKV